MAVAGGRGRMGQLVVAAIYSDENAALSGVLVRPGSPDAGAPVMIGETGLGTGLKYSANPEEVFSGADVVIDFSVPGAGVKHAQAAASARRPLVIGTTGFSDEQLSSIRKCADRAPILVSYNMSLGIAALARVLGPLAETLGEKFHLHITDIHHEKKKDRPSGTALMLAEASGRGREKVKFTSVREGDVVGEHYVKFSGPGEQVEIVHRAKHRKLFAEGALMAAHWLAGRKPGFYTLNDVLKQEGGQ